MLNKVLIAATAALLLATPAIAARQVTVTWTGTVVSGTNENGLFGTVGADLTGATFTTAVTYDLSKMTYQGRHLLQP